MNLILCKAYSSVCPAVTVAAHHLCAKISMKWYVQYIRFEASMESLSCAAFMDIYLDFISTFLAVHLECKYFECSYLNTPFHLLFHWELGCLLKYSIHSFHHLCRKLKTVSMKSDGLDLRKL